MTPEQIYKTGAKVKVYKFKVADGLAVVGPEEELAKLLNLHKSYIAFKAGGYAYTLTKDDAEWLEDNKAQYVPPPPVCQRYMVHAPNTNGSRSYLTYIFSTAATVDELTIAAWAWDDVNYAAPHDTLILEAVNIGEPKPWLTQALTIRRTK